MALRIEFANVDKQAGQCRATLSVGDVLVLTRVQPIEDHFRDLKVNRYFLAKRQLISIFFGNESIAGVDYTDNGMITIYVYKKSGFGSKKLRGELLLSEALSYLDGALDALEVALKLMNLDSKEIDKKVDIDMSLGVYSVYINS